MNRQASRLNGWVAALATALLCASGAFAGDGYSEIDQSMMPLTITDSGPYVLTEDLTGVAGENGITIDASDVTIDFNGFGLRGVPGSRHGVKVTSNQVNIALLNGTVAYWDRYGVEGFDAANALGRDMTVHNNASNGLYFGLSATLIDCVAYSNGMAGFEVENGSMVRNCVAWGNYEHGLDIHSGSTAINCTMSDNGHDGIHGSHAVTLIDIVCDNNGGEGIEVDTGGKIENCTARNNRDDGIKTQGSGSTIINCWTAENVDDGFDLADGSLIRGSTSINNGDEGIRAENSCIVLDCTAERNAQGAGVKATGDGNRIEGNLLTGNKRGAQIQGVNNTLIGNIARDNTSVDFSISVVESNLCSIVDDPGDAIPASPWVNFRL